ncbi:MAG: hypothetical protein AAGG02_19035 [Cyanobacteria bacterium P01_H01_bin.15]
MTRKAVQSLIGEPEDVGESDDILLFGGQGDANLQLTFVDDRVHGIWIYFWGSTDTHSIPDCLDAPSWTINGQTSIDELTEKLSEASTQWRIHKPLTFDDQTCVLVESNVLCLWSHDGKCTLQKIMLIDECNDWSPAT